MRKGFIIAAVAGLAVASSSQAATIDVDTFGPTSATDFAANASLLIVEDFEGQSVGEGDIRASSVGTFLTLGGTGRGASVTGTGTELSVNDASAFGRRNTTLGGANFLDSNDTYGILWTVDVGRAFDRLAFSLSDAAEGGTTMSITVNGETLDTLMRQRNGTVNWIEIDFGGYVNSAEVMLRHSRLNDGFAIDDATVAAIPLPATGGMLLTALGAAAVLRRRSAA